MAYDYISGADWGVGGNWNSGVIPQDADDVSIADGYQGNITGTLDQGAIQLNEVIFPPSFAGNVATSASPLITSAALLKIFSQGEVHFDCSLDGASAADVNDCRIHTHARNLTDAIVTIGSESGDAGEWDKILITRGNVTMRGTILFEAACKVDISPRTDAEATVNIASGADTLPTLNIVRGRVTAENVVTTCNQYGGTLEKKTAAITTLNLFGGTCYWTHATASGTTITVHPGATLDFTRTSQEIVIDALWRLPGSIVLYDPGLVTCTAAYDLTTMR